MFPEEGLADGEEEVVGLVVAGQEVAVVVDSEDLEVEALAAAVQEGNGKIW